MNEKNMNTIQEDIEVSVSDVKLKVTREKLNVKTKVGEAMYGYVLREYVKVNGVDKEFRVDFAARDVGGYEVLSLIFMLADDANLSIREEFMTNEKTGETTSYYVYEVWNTDDDGIVYSYKVKPMQDSDKALLSVILQKRIALMKAEALKGTESKAAKG